jgi:6-pyruvoyltetrahydropterin/6-carboxytetrahydropterin synthase
MTVASLFPPNPICTITEVFTFEAAHRLSSVPDTHKCARLHGHSYKVEVSLRGPITPYWVFDFEDLQKCMKPLLAQLDHHTLNDVEGLFEPTAERLAVWIFHRVKETFSGYLFEVIVHETATSRASYQGTTA